MNKKILIPKYPYLGYSPNLIEYFGIIGYQEELIPQLIKETTKAYNPYPPTILNSVISNIDYGTTDNNLMLSQIYPDNPLILKDDNYYIREKPSPSSVIYSFCFDSQDGTKKLFYTCYAYKFYEVYQLNNNEEKYYIPKAFAVISQYAFFNTFHYICNNLEKIMNLKNKNSLPMEIVIYSLLNYLPTPMNYRINLNVFSLLIKTNQLKLDQLSGYPYIDFDLGTIFNILPINLLLEAYIFTFLEQKILFFSKNLEILNMFMYIMFSLNYPCNDSIYFWHIVSLSPKSFNDDNKFVGKLQNSLLGVNSEYNEDIDTGLFGSYYFIMDLDNKKLFLKYDNNNIEQEEKNEINNLLKLQDYIQNCIKDRYIESFFLKKFIKELKINLENIYYKEQYNNRSIDFFKLSQNIKETNKKIQEYFYNFNLNMLMIFYNDIQLNTSFDKIEYNIKNSENNLRLNGKIISLSENEVLFRNFFRDSIKYKVFFENFIQNFDCIDIFKIGLLFCDEFMNLKRSDFDKNILSNVSLFNIIDTLYFQSMPQTLNISINNLFNEYTEYIKKHFKHLYSNDKKSLEKQLFTLDRKILNKFIYLLNNKYGKDQIIFLFPSMNLKTSDFIASIDQKSIKDVVKNYLINERIVNNYDIILFSVVYIFAITISLHSFNKILDYLGEILYCLKDALFLKRYHINILLETFYNYFLINEENKTYPEMSLDYMKMYLFLIGNYLNKNEIIPDEEMMKIFSNFFRNIMKQKREKKLENSINLDKTQNEDDKLNNNQGFQIKFKFNFFYYVKSAFNYDGIISSKQLIKRAFNYPGFINKIALNIQKVKLIPKCVIRINDYVNVSEIFYPNQIYIDSSILHSDFSENFNYDLKKLNIDKLRSLLNNLILYGLEMTKVKIPFDFLIHSLYILKDFDSK